MLKKDDNRDIPVCCEYCEFAIVINDDDNVLCGKKGIVSKENKCRKYIYDPLKRIPKKLPQIPTLSDDDML